MEEGQISTDSRTEGLSIRIAGPDHPPVDVGGTPLRPSVLFTNPSEFQRFNRVAIYLTPVDSVLRRNHGRILLRILQSGRYQQEALRAMGYLAPHVPQYQFLLGSGHGSGLSESHLG